MRYISTRAQQHSASATKQANTFEEALFSGFAPDGGLFVPERIPQLSQYTLNEWHKQKLSYPEVVAKIVRLYIPEDEISTEDLEKCVQKAYVTKFTDREIIPRKELHIEGFTDKGNTFRVAETYHGKTASFKDLALSLVGQLMDYFLAKNKKHTVVLVGTSGDTGSAAMDAVRESDNIDIIVLYPKGRIAEVQELQLKSILNKNIHLYEVDGTSDDTDVPIKKCFPAENLTSINSINWARIMIQIAHYVFLYISDPDTVGPTPKELHVIVPTGAAGNLVSGIFAYKMGLPIKLHAATNANDCVDKFLSKGVLELGKGVLQTPACAMDIQQPYNIERILYVFSNASTVGKIMNQLESGEGKQAVIPEEVLSSIRRVVKGSLSASDNDIYETIRTYWNNKKYMACPHTATALHYFEEQIVKHGSNGPSSFYVISTASPYKFPEIATKAGIHPKHWEGNKLLDTLRAGPLAVPKTMWKGENWHKILLDQINTIRASKS